MDAGASIHFQGFFQVWIESKFCIFSTAWNWVRILQHEYGDDLSAIKALPDLYDEFYASTENMTHDELWNLMKTRLKQVRGKDHWCPNDESTWTKPFSET